MKKVVLMFIPALICGVVLTSFVSNKTVPKVERAIGEMYEKSEWWQPILEKFNLKLGAYNNFDNVFVMGLEGNSIKNGICTLKAATVLIKGEDDGGYMLFKADSVYHNIEKRTFDFMPVAKNAYTLGTDLNEISTVHGSITRLELLDNGAMRLIGVYTRSN